MKRSNTREHWEKIYASKRPEEFSWTQKNPDTSLDFIHGFNLRKDSKIIDVGGGESELVDRLIEEGYEDITVLDISENALTFTKNRLGEKGKKVKWIVSDVKEFHPNENFDLWHDRATFHFLTTENEINEYLERAKESIRDKGFMTIGTFSEKGPTKCSGLDIKQYTEESLENQLQKSFNKIRCITEDHITPFNTKQNFLFCSFRKSDLSKAGS
jgi:cyclopropane fatty-acyl-phospholipid synthase-like methyltransferase